MNVGNVRIERNGNVVRITQNTKHPIALDCLLTIDEARSLGRLLASMEAPKEDDDDLL